LSAVGGFPARTDCYRDLGLADRSISSGVGRRLGDAEGCRCGNCP